MTTRLPSPWSVPWLSIDVVAALLGVHPRTVRRWIAAGELTAMPGAGRIATAELYRVLSLPVPARPAAPVVDARH